jgi:hypothetical protein
VAVVDDRAMLAFIQVLLDHPEEYTLKPEALRELLSRLRELLTCETTRRRRAHPTEGTGAFVATLVECGASPAKAKNIVAKAEGRTLAAVAKAYERHRNRMRQK